MSEKQDPSAEEQSGQLTGMFFPSHAEYNRYRAMELEQEIDTVRAENFQLRAELAAARTRIAELEQRHA